MVAGGLYCLRDPTIADQRSCQFEDPQACRHHQLRVGHRAGTMYTQGCLFSHFSASPGPSFGSYFRKRRTRESHPENSSGRVALPCFKPSDPRRKQEKRVRFTLPNKLPPYYILEVRRGPGGHLTLVSPWVPESRSGERQPQGPSLR